MKRDVANIVITLPETNETILQKKTLDYNQFWPGFGGMWSLFGGEIRKNEFPEYAARRELEEELGVSGALKFSHSYRQDIRKGSLILNNTGYVFEYETDRDLSKYKIGEGAGIALFHSSELDDVKLIPHDRSALYRVLKNRGIR